MGPGWRFAADWGRDLCGRPLRRGVRLAIGQQAPAFGRKLLESVGVELVVAELQHIPRRARDDQLVLPTATPRFKRLP